MNPQILKSKPLNYAKHIFFGVLAIWALYSGVEHDSSTGYFLASLFGGVTLLEILIFSRATLELNEEELKVQRKMLIGVILDNYTIPLKDIRTSHYEVEKYDFWRLMQNFLFEMFFPSGQSTFTILEMDGKKHELRFDANEPKVKTFLGKLPDRVPNG